MKAITQIDNITHKLVRAAVEKALKQATAETGVTFTLNPGMSTYNSGKTFKITLNGACAGDDGSTQDLEKLNFERLCLQYRMAPQHFGAELTLQGKHFKVSGINPRKRNCPILLTKLDDGKQYYYPSFMVASELPKLG